MRACNCTERKRPMALDLPHGSNERPRQWFVWTRNSRQMRSPGPWGSTWSKYSTVYCYVCMGYWKTKAPYVHKLRDCEYFPQSHPPKTQPYEGFDGRRYRSVFAGSSMSAVLSSCGLYRYRLERNFSDGPTLMFVMVNPSTADASTDDQTIRKCIGFASRNGYGRIIVGNKFAFRATDVNKLREAGNPIGPDNDGYLREMMTEADCIVAGWGQLAKLPETLRARWKDIVRMADAADREINAIGINADKHPKHPQMTGYNEPIAPWAVPYFIGRRPAVSRPHLSTPEK